MKPLRGMALAFGLLALAACGASPSPAAAASRTPATASSPAAAAGGIPVFLSDFKITPGVLTVTPGVVNFAVRNQGPTLHNLTIKDSSGRTLGATRDLRPGETALLTITLPAGSYMAICSLPGHASLGMVDSLTAG